MIKLSKIKGFGDFKGLINLVTSFARVHSPELWVGLGIAGMTTSTVLAVKATPKASRKITNVIEIKNEELLDTAVAEQKGSYVPIDKLPATDVLKLCWKDYAPAAITGVASIVCIIGGTRINLRRNAALVTAVKLSEVTIKDLQNYKNKVVETIGEEKSDEIEAKVDKEHVDRAVAENPTINIDSTFVSGHGSILYLDNIGGQWFRSDRESVREAINSLNFKMNNENSVSLNELYDLLGIPNTIAGGKLGWNSMNGMIEPRFSSQLTPTGVPVVVLSTRVDPRPDYCRMY